VKLFHASQARLDLAHTLAVFADDRQPLQVALHGSERSRVRGCDEPLRASRNTSSSNHPERTNSMAATVSEDIFNGRIFNVVGDSSYATGGYALSAAVLSQLKSGQVVGLNDGNAVIALWDAANLKVKFITASTGAEVANASNQSTNTVKLLLFP